MQGGWQLVPGQHLQHRRHEDSAVLFNALSGDTHLIALSTLDLLLVLREHPGADAARLLELLGSSAAAAGEKPTNASAQEGGTADLLDPLEGLLAELAELDLIETVDALAVGPGAR
jgi:PqqD family protein of HPr-rel-A system